MKLRVIKNLNLKKTGALICMCTMLLSTSVMADMFSTRILMEDPDEDWYPDVADNNYVCSMVRIYL